METSIKYTTDGKKVLVVGKLNNTETIVQEIFVSRNGQEIPSGENFVVKSLHDAPVESWKEKKLRELEKTYETERTAWEKRIQDQKVTFANAVRKSELYAACLFDFVKKGSYEQLDLLKSFLSGEITHVFRDNYSPEILPFDNVSTYDDDLKWGPIHLKLISLFGDSEGNLSYKINQYKDGSGNWCDIYPARSREEALEFAQRLFDKKCEKYLNDGAYLDICKWEKLEGLFIPEEVKYKFYKKMNENITKNINDLEKQIRKLKCSLHG